MTTRTDIISTIIKLRNLADRAGEAEAMAAFRKADKMMQSYAVEEAELAMAEASDDFILDIVHDRHEGATKNGRNRSKAIDTHAALERYCEVEVCYTHNYDVIQITGHRPDVELFKYLADVIHTSMEVEYERWKRMQQAVPRSAKGSFQLGMASRVAERLRDMTRERKAQRDADVADAMKLLEASAADKARTDMANRNYRELTSTALVIVGIAEQKKQEVKAAFRSKHPRLSAGRGFGYASGGTAYSAGRAAGANVNFGRPVGASRQGLLT